MQTTFLFSQVNLQEKGEIVNAIHGIKCIEQLKKFNLVGAWAKTFSAILIGQQGWHSNKCKLSWKLRGTKFGRMYFQLVPLTHNTEEGIEFGFLPTPATIEVNNWERVQYAKDFGQKTLKSRKAGLNIQNNLTNHLNFYGSLLPTPTVNDGKNTSFPPSQAIRSSMIGMILKTIPEPGENSRLNPQFVGEMMGFPIDYLDLPFLETKQ